MISSPDVSPAGAPPLPTITRETLVRDNPHLVAMALEEPRRVVCGAANIRRDLKTAFPGHKFSVTSESFSMGTAIDIRWTDGPTWEEVSAITRRYSQGSFDGMTDSYNYDKDRTWTSTFGSAKYVSPSRNMPDATRPKLYEIIAKAYGLETWTGSERVGTEWLSDLAGRLYGKTSLPPGAEIVGVRADGQLVAVLNQ